MAKVSVIVPVYNGKKYINKLNKRIYIDNNKN